MDRKRLVKSWWLWIILGVVLLGFVVSSATGASDYHAVNTSDAVSQITSGNVTQAVLHDKEQSLDLTLKTAFDGHTKISTSYPSYATPQLFTDLVAAKQKNPTMSFTTKVTKSNTWLSLLFELVPFLLIGGILFFVMSQVQGGGNRVMSFGRSKAKLVSKDTPKTTFADVAGADEAIEELQEIKEFLANPAKFQAIGAKIPKGVLLYGPPGTGKTLLARAVAGEAGVPFYSISGSDFVEMFVGVGASRVRDLFEQAKTNAPAIVFVDEIDAVGRHRGAGMGGGHDEREQTLNQLLVEMDGFDVKGGVILIAATNRPDILDPALLRPGRFDRQIAVGPPDVLGREAVLRVHAKGKPFAQDVDLSIIARRTPGFTGADLANVINEAALLTARNNGRLITTGALEESIDRVIAGPERKTRAMSDDEKRITAYHEAGHALAAWAMPNLDPVHKVTILPRGRSLGHTLVLPLQDKYTETRSEMLDELVYGLGGRAAEELVFHEPTSGASNDIEKATELARNMVTKYGMSAKLGAVKYGTKDSEPFLGRDYNHTRDYSEEVAADIDAEVRDLIEGAHDEAWEILVQYRDLLDALVLELVERETLSKDDLERILAPVRKRPPHNTFTGFGKRTPSDRPPVEIPYSARNSTRRNGVPVGAGTSGAPAGPAAPVAVGSQQTAMLPQGWPPPGQTGPLPAGGVAPGPNGYAVPGNGYGAVPSGNGYGPAQPGNGYGPAQPGNGYGPAQPGNGYGPAQPGNGYGAVPPGGAYGPAQSSGGYVPPYAGNGYSSVPPGNGYGPTQPGAVYGPTQPGNGYGPAQPGNGYGPTETGNGYGPAQQYGSAAPGTGGSTENAPTETGYSAQYPPPQSGPYPGYPERAQDPDGGRQAHP